MYPEMAVFDQDGNRMEFRSGYSKEESLQTTLYDSFAVKGRELTERAILSAVLKLEKSR